jgi:hypothetical protein
MVTIQGQPIPPHTVSVNKQDKHVLDVDIETAWNELGLKSGWANEVEVKVYFGRTELGWKKLSWVGEKISWIVGR